MPERTLEERYRLLAASFRESRASVLMRESLGDDFQVALDSVVASLWRDVATQPRDLDRDKIASLLDTLLPGRLAGNEKWKSSVPDVLESFLAFVAEEESLSTAWEWSTAIDEHRAEHLGGVKYAPDRRPSAKLGRNDPCFCGSGKKYKHCCLKLFP